MHLDILAVHTRFAIGCTFVLICFRLQLGGLEPGRRVEESRTEAAMSVAALKAELAAMPALEMTIRTRYLNVESRLQQEQQMNTLAPH